MKIRRILLAIGFLLSIFLVVRWFWNTLLHERIIAFFRKPLPGKNWQSEIEKFDSLYPKSGLPCILFLGDSHIEQCEWGELFHGMDTRNRGIGGESSSALLLRLRATVQGMNPEIIIVQTGINDLIFGVSPDSVLENHRKIYFFFKNQTGKYLPTLIFPTRYLTEVNTKVDCLNNKLRAFYKEQGVNILDIGPQISEGGRLSESCTIDGIHLNARGYKIWQKKIGFNCAKSAGFR